MQAASKLLVADLVLRTHPADAEAYALARIEERRAEGDVGGVNTWSDILETVRALKPRQTT